MELKSSRRRIVKKSLMKLLKKKKFQSDIKSRLLNHLRAIGVQDRRLIFLSSLFSQKKKWRWQRLLH